MMIQKKMFRCENGDKWMSGLNEIFIGGNCGCLTPSVFKERMGLQQYNPPPVSFHLNDGQPILKLSKDFLLDDSTLSLNKLSLGKPVYITESGQLMNVNLMDIHGNPVRLTNINNGLWYIDGITVKFGSRLFFNVEISFDGKQLEVTGDSTIGGIDLTFWMNKEHTAFVSDENINIIHIVTGFTHTLTDFIIDQNGLVSATLNNCYLTDESGNMLILQYNEKNDTWHSQGNKIIKYGKSIYADAKVWLDDYDFILHGKPEFSNNSIDFNLGYSKTEGPFFWVNQSKIHINDYELTQCNISIYRSGKICADAIFHYLNKKVDLEYKDGQFVGKTELWKKYKAPEKGFFETEKYYVLHETINYTLDIKQKKIKIVPVRLTVTNPYVCQTQRSDRNYHIPVVELTLDEKDGTYKAEIHQQTVKYLGKARNGFLGEYFFEEAKFYEFRMDTHELKVGSKLIKAHGAILTHRVYNYYYPDFEKLCFYEGIWPFRSQKYDYYFQVLSS